MNGISDFLNNKRKVIFLDEIDSTNNYAKKMAQQGEAAGTLVIAGKQTAGKGRLGRSFCSPDNTGIYMSVILRPDTSLENISMLTSMMAVAAARAIEKLYYTDIKIKWVNDLYLNGKKICGILTESSVNSYGKADFAIVGIGINVKSIKNSFSPELLEIASSLEDETDRVVPMEQLAAEIINQLDILMPDIEKADYIKEYRSRLCIIGCDVIICKNNKEYIARAVDVTDRAGLLVEYADGSREVVTSGEARIKKS